MNTIRKTNNLFPSLLTSDFDSTWFDMRKSESKAKQVPVNIRETDTNYFIDLSIPGFKKEDVNVEVDGNKLKVSAEHAEKMNQEGKFTRLEFEPTSFSRTFTLPKEISSENISGTYENGILTVTLSKPEKKVILPKRIELK